jgi:hypothetical protein
MKFLLPLMAFCLFSVCSIAHAQNGILPTGAQTLDCPGGVCPLPGDITYSQPILAEPTDLHTPLEGAAFSVLEYQIVDRPREFGFLSNARVVVWRPLTRRVVSFPINTVRQVLHRCQCR